MLKPIWLSLFLLSSSSFKTFSITVVNDTKKMLYVALEDPLVMHHFDIPKYRSILPGHRINDLKFILYADVICCKFDLDRPSHMHCPCIFVSAKGVEACCFFRTCLSSVDFHKEALHLEEDLFTGEVRFRWGV